MTLFLPLVTIPTISFADADSLSIIPDGNEETITDAIKAIWSEWGSVIDNYNTEVAKLSCEDQIASGIRDRWTILCYAVNLVSFLSQVGIFIGAMMIIYAGYIYATAVFNGGNASAGKTAVTRAILGVVVIVFSYAIVRIVTRAFLT